jgi:hypothetical protein
MFLDSYGSILLKYKPKALPDSRESLNWANEWTVNRETSIFHVALLALKAISRTVTIILRIIS